MQLFKQATKLLTSFRVRFHLQMATEPRIQKVLMIDDWFVSCTFTFECWIIDSIEGANANQNEMVMLEMQKQ